MLKNYIQKLLFILSLSSSYLGADCSCHSSPSDARDFKTKTPIKHLVVIYAENCSFDHFFATYPHALNPPGEPQFEPKDNTPSINGLTQGLIDHNTNLIKPFRLKRSQAATCNPKHTYTLLQTAAHGGLMDRFIQVNPSCSDAMGYFDGNTVTALWNYAQHFAMSDNCFTTTFTPSAPGAINLISGQTHGAHPANLVVGTKIYTIDGTLIDDADPHFDKCSEPELKVKLTGKNVGNLLNNKHISWGWFQGGFRNCERTHIGSDGKPVADYVPHHEPFQYYASTSNPNHLPPASVEEIGFDGQANHQYDIRDFWSAVKIHRIPAVSFLKPPAYRNNHPGYSDPLAFQTFLVNTVNRLQKLPEWKSMAIIIAWDDAGGWYDHVMPPIINQSHTPADALLGPGDAGNPPPGAYQARLAYGMRLPFLILSPYAKCNFVDHTVIDQTSILRFIEKNWGLNKIGNQSFDQFAGPLSNMFDFDRRRSTRLILDPDTGLVVDKGWCF